MDFDRNNNQEIYKPSFQSTGEYSFTAKAYNYPYGFTPFHVILAEKLINDTIKSSNHGSKIWHLAVNSKKKRVRKKNLARFFREAFTNSNSKSGDY